MVWLIIYNLTFWTFMGMLAYGYIRAFRSGWQNLRRLHQIPCSRCVFFTANYRLKCTVHPDRALSLAAIGCRDYQTY